MNQRVGLREDDGFLGIRMRKRVSWWRGLKSPFRFRYEVWS